MIVYVESNFVLELAFVREEYESCIQIINLARANQINLVLPAYSVGEPYEAFVRRSKKRRNLHAQLSQEIKELSRSKPYSTFMQDSQDIANLLIQSIEEERKGIDETLNNMLALADIIPIEANVIASAISFQESLNLSSQDSIVYASILNHLERTNSEPKCFLTTNIKDFVNPDIFEHLNSYNCKLLTRFVDGLGYIQNNSGIADST